MVYYFKFDPIVAVETMARTLSFIYEARNWIVIIITQVNNTVHAEGMIK